MSVLHEAINAAEMRKRSAGLAEENQEPQLVFSNNELTDRAVFSGFDIDYDELCAVVLQVAAFFCTQAPSQGLVYLFSACWADGLLAGLMVNNVAPHHDPPGPTPPGSGGNSGSEQ